MRKDRPTDQDLLADLLNQQPAEADRRPAEADQPDRRQARPAARRSRRGSGVFDRLVYSTAMLSALYLIFLLWQFGATASLNFVGQVVDLTPYGSAVWLLPVGITLVEVYTTHMLTRLPWALFYGAVLTFDVGTTAIGVVGLLAGLSLPLLGYTIPTTGQELWAASLAVGLASAFLPEPLARLALAELAAVWK